MRSAVFVDAGYFYAQGSKAVSGQKLVRTQIALDLPKVISKLRDESCKRTSDASLLRIYWYDGLAHGGLSQDQQRLAYMEDVKLRLGIVNQSGQQKGVDSLIVTDLVELARNHAITDAILLSGDEDLRIGVQIAQSFGVRVHLIGIEPSRGSQSLSLLQEADTTTEWNKDVLSELMSLLSDSSYLNQSPGSYAQSLMGRGTEDELELTVNGYLSSLDKQEVSVLSRLGDFENVPPQFDRRLLASCRTALGRDLDSYEKDQMRKLLRKLAKEKSVNMEQLSHPTPPPGYPICP